MYCYPQVVERSFMLADLRARYAAFVDAHPRAASIARHAAITFASAFLLLVLPEVDKVLNGGPLDLAALKAAALAGTAAGLRAVGLWIRGSVSL